MARGSGDVGHRGGAWSRGDGRGRLLQRRWVGRWRHAELRERGKKGEAMGIEREWLQVCARLAAEGNEKEGIGRERSSPVAARGEKVGLELG